MKALVASLLTAAVITGAAWASNVTPQQVSALNARVTALSKSNAQLVVYVNKCLHAFVGVAEYGGYTETLTSGSTDTNANALDLVAQGDTPDYFVAYSKVDCTALTP